ncbi:MAG: PAS domain S-box protein [Anaerolineae bacterium]
MLDDPELYKRFIHPDDLEKGTIERCNPAFRMDAEIEHRIVRPDGEVRWLRRQTWVRYDQKGQPVQLTDLAQDITDRREAEQQLRLSEEKFAKIFAKSPDSLLLSRIADGVCVDANDKFLESNGLTRDEVVGQISPAWGEGLIHPDDLQRGRQVFFEQGVVRNLEVRTRNKSDDVRFSILSSEIIELNGEKYALTVLHDITDRKHMEMKLRESEERFRNLIETAPIAIVLSDKRGSITMFNQEAEHLFGYVESDVLGQPIEMLVPEAANEHHLKLREIYMAEPSRRTMASHRRVEGRHRSGGLFQIEVGLGYFDAGGEINIINFITDITERTLFTEALVSSEEKYRSLVNSSDAAISMVDANGQYLYLNEICTIPFGVRPEELVGKNVYDLFPLPEADKIMADVKQVIAQDTGITLESEVTLKGEPCWFKTSIQPVRDTAGKPYAAQIYAMEITSIKRAEAALRASELRYRSIVEDQTELICRYDTNFCLTFGNAAYCRSFGLSPEEIVGKSIFDKIPPEEHETARDYLRSLTVENPMAVSVHHSIQPDGSRRWVEWKDRAIFDDNGAIVEYQGVGRDITEQKSAENALFESEQRLRLFIEHAPAAITMLDKNMVVLAASRRWIEDYRLGESNIVGRSHYDLFPEIPERWKEIHRRCLAGTVEKHDKDPFSRADGKLDWVRWEIHPWRHSNGEIGGILLFSEVITDRVNAEKILRASENRYRQMFEVHGLPKLIIDPEGGGIVDANPAAAQFYGHDVDTLKSLTIFDVNLSPPDEVREKMQHALDKKMLSCDFIHRGANARPRNVEIFTGLVEQDNKKLLYSIITDVTEKVMAETALQETLDLLEQRVAERTAELERSKERIEAIFNHSGDGILLIDVNEGLRQANVAFVEMFGLGNAGYFGSALSEYFQPDNAAIIIRQLSAVVQSRQTTSVEARAKRADGSGFDVEISFAPVDGADKAVTNIVCIIRDVSQRKDSERALRESELMLKSVIENIPVRIFWKDRHSVYRGCNGLHARANGMTSPNQVIGKTDHDFLPERAAEFEASDRQVIESGNSLLNMEELVVDADGSEHWLRSNKMALRDPEGIVTGVLVTVEDVTERKNVVLAIAEERNLLRTVVDAVPDFIYVKDKQHRMILNNASHARTLNVNEPLDAVGKTDYEFFPQEMAAGFYADEERLLQSEQSVINVQERTIGLDGSEIWALTTKVPLRNLDGDLIGLVGITRDVTEIKSKEDALLRSELQLRQSQKMLQTVLDTIPVRVFWKDPQANYLGCNRLFAQDAGLADSSDIIGKSDFEMPWLAGEAAAYRADDMQVMETGTPKLDYEESIRTAGGQSLVIQTYKLPLRDMNNNIFGVLGAYIDITRRKQAEAALEQKLQEERDRQSSFKALHEVTLRLTQAESLDDFYRAVVQAGLQEFGFERMGLLLYDSTSGMARGTYGTDATGQLVGEHHIKLKLAELTGILERTHDRTQQFLFEDNAMLYANSEPIGIGQNAVTSLWDSEIIGWLAVDNGTEHRPITRSQLDILALYGLSVSSLLARKRAEVAMRESEERYRLLAENVSDVIIKLSPGGDLTFVTPSVSTLLGYLPEEFVGTKGISHIHPDDATRSATVFLNSIESKLVHYSVEQRVIHKDGSPVWVEATNTNVFDAGSGAAVEMIGVLRDITDRKEAEAVLARQLEEEQQLQKYFQSLHTIAIELTQIDGLDAFYRAVVEMGLQRLGFDRVGLFLFDPETNEAQGTYGTDTEGNIQSEFHIKFTLSPNGGMWSSMQNPNRFYFADDYPLEHNREIVGRGWNTAVALWHGDRNLGWLSADNLIHHAPVSQIQLEALAQYGIYVAASLARQQIEESLRASEEKFRSFVESAPIATIIADQHGNIALANKVAEDLFDYQQVELVGRAVEELVPDEFRMSHSRDRGQYMTGEIPRRSHAVEAFGRRRDGNQFPAEIQLSYVAAPEGPMVMTYVIDISARKQAEDALKQALEQEKELGELKSRFVSMASHEFRTPLAGILATTESLSIYRNRMDNAQIDNRLNKIRQQVMHMRNIMEDMLQMSRLQAGQMEFKPANGNLETLCREIIEEFENQPEYFGRITLENRNQQLMTEFDERLMRHAIGNLVSNALKYSSKDAPVYISLVDEGTHAVVEVRDSGIGIPPDDFRHLFEPFHRAKNVGTISGTGLGLSITKQAVELHGGTIVPQSEIDKGTTFIVRIPKTVIKEVGDDKDTSY